MLNDCNCYKRRFVAAFRQAMSPEPVATGGGSCTRWGITRFLEGFAKNMRSRPSMIPQITQINSARVETKKKEIAMRTLEMKAKTASASAVAPEEEHQVVEVHRSRPLSASSTLRRAADSSGGKLRKRHSRHSEILPCRMPDALRQELSASIRENNRHKTAASLEELLRAVVEASQKGFPKKKKQARTAQVSQKDLGKWALAHASLGC